MHIENDKLVGSYVSEVYPENGAVTIIIVDGDSTPTREFTRYKYVQTEQLTSIGVAVKDYGAILVPETTIELFESGVLNATDFGIFVKFNDDYYSISLASLLGKDIGASVEFEENSFDDYPTVTFNATLPPYSVGNAGQVPTVDENGKVGWDNIPEELPAVTGNTGKFLGVNDGATGVEWKNVPNELPAIGDSDAGKVLKVNAEHTGTEWGAIPNELPAIASGDAGKVLKVNSGGTGVEWGAAGGGSIKYQHNIHLSGESGSYYFSIITSSNTAITASTLINQIATAYGANHSIPVSGYRYANSTLYFMQALYYSTYNIYQNLNLRYCDISGNSDTLTIASASLASYIVEDYVITI